MFPAENHLKSRLEKRASDDALRKLTQHRLPVDFCSNDYLGFARSKTLRKNIDNYAAKNGIGSTGSRLLTGNSPLVEELERFIADYHRAEAGLIFNSGYDANLGLFSSVPQKGDTVIYDEYIHASVHDGIRLGKAISYKFRHNEAAHLEELLKISEGNAYVAVESVYSMDGDFAPLKEVAGLCKKYRALLVVDEAHATGVFGSRGEGRVVELGLEADVFARVHTFGKALGCHGAIVLGSRILREYLINFARSFIYTTALGNDSLIAVKCAYDLLLNRDDIKFKTSSLISLFNQKAEDLNIAGKIESQSPIQCLLLPGNKRVKTLAKKIQDSGFDVRPILSPTVPKGSERLRICLHAFNTEKEVVGLLECLKKNL